MIAALLSFGAGCSSSDDSKGYTPKDRATQFARALNEERGDDPTAEVTCKYKAADGGGSEWYECGTGGWWIACSSETTPEPLTGDWNRRQVYWGDCAVD